MIIIKITIDEGFSEIYAAGGSDRLSQAVRLRRHDYSFATFIILIIVIMMMIIIMTVIIISIIIMLSACHTWLA